MTRNNVTIVDYGLGNLLSVKRAFEFFNVEVEISNSPSTLQKAEKLIIPGVGAFPRGMEELRKRNLIDAIKSFSQTERPLLAICLGMQLLMEFGEEHQKTSGLNLVKGKVVRFPKSTQDFKKIKIPNVGWGEILLHSKNVNYEKYREIENAQMYFVHSYYVELENRNDSLATTKNEEFEFCSMISSENILGCQFHPEKSGKFGLNLIQEFLSL